MSLRRVMTALCVVPALAIPAGASEPTTTGLNNGLAGTVASTMQLLSGHTITASCTFAGALTPSNTLVVEFAGTAVSTGTPNQTAPLLTAIECEINNASEGGTEVQTQDFSLNGPATAAASSTLLATNGPKEWPVKDITVCVSAFAVYGPTPVIKPELTRQCTTPNG
jgi:hypothetical protein